MTLKEKIAQYQRESAGKATAEMKAVMQSSTAELQASVANRGIPEVGDSLLPFKLPDSNGNTVSSAELLVAGPLIVTFFRGMW